MPAAASPSRYPLVYEPDCHLLRACAELLRLPPSAIATGLLFLHRFRAASANAAGIDSNVTF